MKRAAAILASLVLVTALAGCGPDSGRGYFYVVPHSSGYTVDLMVGATDTEISKPVPLSAAKAVCDALNRDLGQNARGLNREGYEE